MCSLPHSQAVAVSESDPLSRYCSVCVLVTLILVNSGPKSTAGDLDMPKRNRKVLPFSEKVHMHRKNIYRVWNNSRFQASTVGLGTSALRIRGGLLLLHKEKELMNFFSNGCSFSFELLFPLY